MCIAYGLAHLRYSDAEDGEGHHDKEEEADVMMQDSGATLTASRSADEAIDVTSKFGARGQCDPLLLSVFFFYCNSDVVGGGEGWGGGTSQSTTNTPIPPPHRRYLFFI